MKRKLFFAMCVSLALVVTGISYASTQATKTVAVTSTGFADVYQSTDSSGSHAGKYGTVDFTSWQPAANTSGTTGTGDLYTIERSADATGDIYGTVYLSNAGALSNDYSYLNLQVTVYGKNSADAAWSKVSTNVLSLANGYVSFTLDETYDTYSVSVDDGSYYCVSTANSGGSSLSPEYYVEIR